MGCVLVKRATPDHRPKSTSRRRSGEQSSAAENVKQVSLNEVGGNRKDGVVDRIRQSIGEVPAPDRRRPKPQYTLKTSQGWPSWLCDVAGDAIKDWTPRLANTFEKLDKVKCYMKQLLSGLEHCHENGVLHRDIKGSNLLIDNDGILKIADFGLASFFNPQHKQPMTSRVVTLWYRPPELLLGATYYGVGVDLWSAGCILAELLAGKPILPGRTEVEQLHKIFRLCGSPSEEYWKRHRLPNATLFKPQHPYKRCTAETFKDFPPASLPLLERLLAIDPNERGSATSALNSNFFTAEPYACEPSELPKYPPSKEIDVKLREEEARRQRGLSGKSHAPDGNRRTRPRDRVSRAVPAPEANAEIQSNVDRRRVVTEANAKSKSEKFPPPHQDAAVGYPSNNGGPVSFFTTDDNSFGSSIFDSNSSRSVKEHGTIGGSSRRRKTKKEPPSRAGPSRKFIHTFLPTSISLSMDLGFRGKEPVSDVFGSKR
ncbi:probable serine/threonine-protein kinase At1g54610 isoform X2 [Cynara cardunculus var. scolymus]|uniref:probable serine/threonine-protein kinase At1g54610 isoform X2 n=1 Tax=Cynara cardunculus var. scolymus TaxID=59895 RepID=UPI000D62F9C0|nr:probable serine/threonine-protein kinase At1g54610 isoform X2 [Cynara cardunculus var. scolymus]